MSYSTKQKRQILDTISSLEQDFSIKELEKILQNNGVKVGQTTIYRFIEQMLADGQLKVIANSDAKRYQYIERCGRHGHCYLKCNQCGNLEHIDCAALNTLEEHVENEHGFKMTEENIIINGICEACL